MIKRILVVDGDVKYGESIRKYLNMKGFEAEYAWNENEAYLKMKNSMIEERTFDLVIARLLLPEMDGKELIEMLDEEFYDISILVISETPFCDSVKNYLKKDRDFYCYKPIGPRKLIEVIKALSIKRGRCQM